MTTISAQANTRWEEIKNLWRENDFLYAIGGFLLGLLAFPLVEWILTDSQSLLGDLVPEAVGIVFTVLFIDTLYHRRESQQRKFNLQQRLIREAGSQINDLAVKAIEEIRYHKWHKGKNNIMRGQEFWHANLNQAKLAGFNLSYVILSGANLCETKLHEVSFENSKLDYAQLKEAKGFKINFQHADISGSNMTNAVLEHSNFSDCRLVFCVAEKAKFGASNFIRANARHINMLNGDFQEVDLTQANLSDSNLQNVNFCRAKLFRTNLENADLSGAIFKHPIHGEATFNTETILPDGKAWTSDTDMPRYTNPDHPDFWQPDWVKNNKSS